MAELTPRERLQPSLLDRLTDDDPASKVEPRERRVLSPSQLRECVRRDLTWLFNTTQPGSTIPGLAEAPLASGSVVNFGIPDLAGRTASTVDLSALERLLRQAIWDFEPRLVRGSVKVRGLLDDRAMSHNAISFAIEAELWAQPMPLQLFLRTQVDLEDGRVLVSEMSERKGA
jgi:type VI secretion system protein ImpF